MKSQDTNQKPRVLKKPLLCSLSALLLILSFPNFNLWLFAWFGFLPLFFAIKNESKIKTFLFSYLTGLIFWLGVIYWLIYVTVIGMIILILYLALYFGIFGLVVSTFSRKRSTANLLFIPAFWVVLEYLRSQLFTGFGWALLGYTQYLNLPIIQIADVTGTWGVSFLIIMVNLMIYSAINYRLSIIREKIKYLIPLSLLIITLIYGYYKLYRIANVENQLVLKISVIQGNIPQSIKWDTQEKSLILGRYLDLSKDAARESPDLILWPESAYPDYLDGKNVNSDIQRQLSPLNTPFVMGIVVQENERYYNSAVLISSAGNITQRYDKLHLVPFGEYIPLKKVLPFLDTIVPIGDFTAGKEYTVFSLALPRNPKQTIYFAALICFEDIFPELSRRFVKKGARFLINLTNDAWFGKTSSPYQHLQASVFRAVENRTPLIRSANTGISSFINPDGKITSLVKDYQGQDIFVSGYKTGKIELKRNGSFYTKFGDLFFLGCLAGVIYMTIISTTHNRGSY